MVPLRGGRPVFLATSPAISATAIAGRWVAWLAGPPPNSRPDSRATLTIADRLTRRVHERLSFPVAGSEGAAGVSIALEADGRAALLLPGREVGGPCTAPSTLGWTSPRDPRLHRIATGLAVGRGLALAGGRALVERGRLSPAGNCDQAGSLVAVRLSDGATRPVATFGPDETAAGNLDWDGRHAAFAAIVREGAPEDPTYRTSIRLAAMS